MTTESIFFRLLKEDDKEAALRRCIADLRVGRPNLLTHAVRQETFALLPGFPMPYWVSNAMRAKFKELTPFEGNGGPETVAFAFALFIAACSARAPGHS